MANEKIKVKPYQLTKGERLTDEKKIEIAKEVFRVEVEGGYSEKAACKALGINYGSFKAWRKEDNRAFVSQVSHLYKNKRERKTRTQDEQTLELAEKAIHWRLKTQELKKGNTMVEEGPHPSIIMFALKNLKEKVYGENKDKQAVEIKGGLTVPASMVNPVACEINIEMTRNFDLYKTVRLVSGARSGKTVVIADIKIDWLMTGKLFGRTLDETSAIMLKPTFESMRHTLIKSFTDRLDQRGLASLVKHNQSDKSFSYDGRKVIYMGLDKPSHNIEGGQFALAWFNECNYGDSEVIAQIRGRTEGTVFVDANPSELVGWIRDLKKEEDVYSRHLKLDDNYFLNPRVKEALLKQGKRDPWFQKVYIDGVRAPRKGAIYEGWTIVSEEPKNYDYKYLGIDFGHTNPSAVALVKISEGGKNGKQDLYWKQLAYVPALSSKAIADLIVEHKCHGIADSASPEIIDIINLELRKMKSEYECIPALKTGVADECREIATNFNMFVDKGSPDLLQEIQMYRMAIIKARAGNIQTDIPVHKDNHLMDAGRYGTMYSHRIRLREIANSL